MYNYPQIDAEAIKTAIVDGMVKGYNKCLMYLGETEEGLSSVREYILTVSVADTLLEKYLSIYQVRVEQPYQKFSDDAFPPSGFRNNDIFDSITRRQVFIKPDSRKIDIGLSTANGKRSLCGIEIKAINQPYNKIISDIDRLSEALIRKDEVDESSLQACFVTFLIRSDKRFEYVHLADVRKSEKKSRAKIEKNLLTLRSKYKDLTYTVECYDIDTSTVEQESKRVFDDGEDFSHRTRAIFGYIIKILPNKIDKDKKS